MKTVAVDFDGVIHSYTKGWQDGSCYDRPVPGAFEGIKRLMDAGYAVFILTTRNTRQVKRWLKENAYDSEYIVDGMGGDPNDFCYPKYGFTVERIPFWKKFWNKPNVLGITNRKLAAAVYIDDRAVVFRGYWHETFDEVAGFKTYQERE